MKIAPPAARLCATQPPFASDRRHDDHQDQSGKQPQEALLGPLFELSLAHVSGRMTAGRLTDELKAAIEDGRLAHGAQLPPTRRATTMFRVSRNTVAEAYERLMQDGLVVARHGSGTFVAERGEARERAPSPSPASFRTNPLWSDPAVRSAMDFWSEGEAGDASGPVTADFRPALVDSRLFPLDTLRRVMTREMRRIETKPPSFKSPQGNQGNYHLRAGIAKHIAVTRSIASEPGDVIVTAGAQQGFDLLARVLVIPGETVVAVEDPGYPPMRVPFQAAGARIVPIPVDADGLRVDLLPDDVGVICVCPSHQFPLGMPMSSRRRAELVAFAREGGALIVEDDYDGEFRHEGSPLEALRSADTADVVAYVGTFSKCMLPSLRLGFLIPPAVLRVPIIGARNALDWHSPSPVQACVAGFISDGELARHVRRLRALYGRRRSRLVTGLETLGDRLTPIPSTYGMHISAIVGQPERLDGAVRELRARGIEIHTLERYSQLPNGPAGLVLGIGAVDETDIDRTIAGLRETL